MDSIVISIILLACVIVGSVARSVVGILTKPKDEPFIPRYLAASVISAVVEGVAIGVLFLQSNMSFDATGMVLVCAMAVKFGWNSGKDVGNVALNAIDKAKGV